MERRFQIIEHPADVGFLAYGATLAELFANAAGAMCALACAPQEIEERIEREIFSRGANVESLFYAWLSEILAVADAEQIAGRRVDIIFSANLEKRNPEKCAEFFLERNLTASGTPPAHTSRR